MVRVKTLIKRAIKYAKEHHLVSEKDILAVDVKHEQIPVLKIEEDVVEIYLRGSPVYVSVHFDKKGKITQSYIAWVNPPE